MGQSSNEVAVALNSLMQYHNKCNKLTTAETPSSLAFSYPSGFSEVYE